MNLFDSSFLCLDIGTSGVRGIAHRIKSGKIYKSALYSIESFDTVYALKAVIDELETQLSTHFDDAYITGNFGDVIFSIQVKNTLWGNEHKISQSDINEQLSQIETPENFYPMHIIPLRYDTPSARNMYSPIGHTDRQLKSAFGVIFYERERLDEIFSYLRQAHIQAKGFFDGQYLEAQNTKLNKQNIMFIDIGAEYTSASIWTGCGPVWYFKTKLAGTKITEDIAEKLHIDFDEVERIKPGVITLSIKDMDRFTPADSAYEFSRADMNDISTPHFIEIIKEIKENCTKAFSRYRPHKIILSGGNSDAESIKDFFENAFAIPVEIAGNYAYVKALSNYIWELERPHRNAYQARQNKIQNITENFLRLFKKRQKKKKNNFIPIMPSTLCFDMKNIQTYSLFNSAGISIIHIDMMDGLYVSEIASSPEEVKFIREHTKAHLHVHLMTESPAIIAAEVVRSGADTVIVSPHTSGLKTALIETKKAGKRVGIALNPEDSVSILKPVLRNIDEVMVMTVKPGAAGQEFDENCLNKVRILNATRKRYNLNLTISVDGGINEKTAQLCWGAGADLLVSGSYLAKSSDFPLAVQKLLKQNIND